VKKCRDEGYLLYSGGGGVSELGGDFARMERRNYGLELFCVWAVKTRLQHRRASEGRPFNSTPGRVPKRRLLTELFSTGTG
jgi:hypothetical protein